MQMSVAALKAYQSVRSESLAHGGKGAELVVMLYDGILESINLAGAHVLGKRHSEAGRQYARALTIISGLRETLDFDRGSPVADQLFEFYNALSLRLIHAQTKRDLTVVQECYDLVNSVRESWVALSTNAAVRTAGGMGPTVRAASVGLS